MAEQLKRRIGLGLLTAYGVGVMVGAGIYVLVGLVAAGAGVWAPLAFLLAGLVALPSALAYGELATRMPEAAGEVAFVEAGFGSRALAILVGVSVVVAGIISAAAVLRGGAGYFLSLVPVSDWTVIIAGGALLTFIAVVGVLESLTVAAIFTVVEVLGLLLVAGAGFSAEPSLEWSASGAPQWGGVFGAVALCFFAFIGFEDLENMAEEVRNPTQTMPRAILLALAITAVLYALVSMAAVRAVPTAMLGASDQPLALVWEVATGRSAAFLSAIAVVAAVNGVLAQIVMASRVLFGLGRRSSVFAIFTRADARFGTPVLATVLVGVAVVGAALMLPVAALAEATAIVLLAVFFLVNLALVLLKLKKPEAPFRIPFWVPVLGIFLALGALVLSLGVPF